MPMTEERLAQVEGAIQQVLRDFVCKPLLHDGFRPNGIDKILRRSVDKVTAELKAAEEEGVL